VATIQRARAKRLTADERRAQLLEAARRVFVRSGFAAARIRTISEEAGVNEALLYRHFESKEALFEAAVAEPLEEAVERLLAIGRAGHVVTETQELREQHLFNLLDELLRSMVDSAPLLGMVLMAEPERGQDFYGRRFAPAMRRLVVAIEEAQGAWPHRVPADIVLHACMGACLMLAIDQRFDGSVVQEDPEAVVRHLTPPPHPLRARCPRPAAAGPVVAAGRAW
jgi:TetR/AcrR family transcriptional regulator